MFQVLGVPGIFNGEIINSFLSYILHYAEMEDNIKVGLKAALDDINLFKNSLAWRNFVIKKKLQFT